MALKELYSRHGCTPALTFALSLAQFPVFIAASLDLRYLITTNHSSEFASQGLLFIPDLTACDPTLISPLILGLLHYHNSKKIRYRAVMWMFTIGSSYVASLVPAGVLLYWVTSATFSAVIHQLRLLD